MRLPQAHSESLCLLRALRELPSRHLPRGSKYPGGGQAQASPAARKLFFEDTTDEAAGRALMALAGYAA